MRQNNNNAKLLLLSIILLLALSSLITTVEVNPAKGLNPQGLLVVTRPMFVDSLTQYIQWKNSEGFEVYVVTADWIQDNVNGGNLTDKIRNCIRQYYYNKGVKYAMLIGDAVDISGNLLAEQPPTTLSQNWNLPAGYYWLDLNDGVQYTSLYYSDLTNKTHYYNYATDKNCEAGDYKIYVGIVPVKTVNELKIIFSKTINYYSSPQATILISNDSVAPPYRNVYYKIQALAGSNVSVGVSIYNQNASSNEIHNNLFEKEGVIYESAHGSTDLFTMDNTVITSKNATDFKNINSLFVSCSCNNNDYYARTNSNPDSLCEAFLKAQKGPVVVIGGGIPWSQVTPGELSDQEIGFWTDLFKGKTVGQAFYDNCKGAVMNPFELFGDPSLVIYGGPSPSPSPSPFPSPTSTPIPTPTLTVSPTPTPYPTTSLTYSPSLTTTPFQTPTNEASSSLPDSTTPPVTSTPSLVATMTTSYSSQNTTLSPNNLEFTVTLLVVLAIILAVAGIVFYKKRHDKT